MVASLDQKCLQGDFSTLVVLFDRVGLMTNYRMNVDMVSSLCQATGTHSDVAYGRRMMGEGP